ncbi:MAG: hypothetical protein LN575_03745 [Rickettsia endosymbiont of Gnoriste bilineata]|nr:hypothetical protein [Rickettsia endosymbiont of Gnoriste bilineata]
MFTSNLVDKSDIGFLYCVKSQLFFIQGKYPKALDQINQDIAESIKQGLKPDDFFLTSRYMLKAEILNYLKKYQEAHAVVEQLYDMYKSSKKEEHEIFGRIFAQWQEVSYGLVS